MNILTALRRHCLHAEERHPMWLMAQRFGEFLDKYRPLPVYMIETGRRSNAGRPIRMPLLGIPRRDSPDVWRASDKIFGKYDSVNRETSELTIPE
jgi:hypothetical protein